MSQPSLIRDVSKGNEPVHGRNICIPVFSAAWFTIPKTQIQPKCPSIDESIQKICCIWHAHARIYTQDSIQP
jgi:hypothetical protein